MAFSKEVLKSSGVKTKYHKISGIEIDFIKEECLVEIESYKNEEYRNLAKDKDKLIRDIENLIAQIEIAESTELRNSLEDKVKELQVNNREMLSNDYVACKEVITLNYIPKDCSIESFYKELSKLEKFSDSEAV